jgi:hypothetical protein
MSDKREQGPQVTVKSSRIIDLEHKPKKELTGKEKRTLNLIPFGKQEKETGEFKIFDNAPRKPMFTEQQEFEKQFDDELQALNADIEKEKNEVEKKKYKEQKKIMERKQKELEKYWIRQEQQRKIDERKYFEDIRKSNKVKGKKTDIICTNCLMPYRLHGTINGLEMEGKIRVINYMVQNDSGLHCQICGMHIPDHLILD